MTHELSLREQFYKVVEEKIRPAMKKKGFSCSKNRIWNRKRGRLIDVVEIELSSTVSSLNFFSFTISAGVVIPEIDEIVWNKKKSAFFREPYGVVRARVGQIIADAFSKDGKEKPFRDIWWDVDSTEAIEKIIDEIYGLMTTKTIDFLDRFGSLEEIESLLSLHKKIWEQSYPLPKMQLGVLRVLLGKKEEGKILLMEIVKGGGGWAGKSLDVLKRLGLEQSMTS